jgi:hypothetical protein
MRKGKFLLLLIILFFISSCATFDSQEAERSRITVVSLNSSWPKLQEKAQEWHSDAHLLSATLPIMVDSSSPLEYFLATYFLSSSDPENMLKVTLGSNGYIQSKEISIIPMENRKSIMREDWMLDSGDALDKMLTINDIRFLVSRSDKHCSDLSLERNPRLTNKSVVWYLDVYDCEISNYSHIEYIDALSGESQ